MQNSKLLIVIFVVLASASYFILKNNKTNNTSTIDEFLIPQLQAKINDISHIEISKDSKTITLNKENNIWRIAQSGNFLANTNKIATLLMELRSLKLKQAKTKDSSKYAKLELSDDTAIKLVLKNTKGIVANILIGKKSQRGQGVYVRKNDEKQTWLASGNVNIDFDSKTWIVTTILDVDSTNIKSITYAPTGLNGFTISKATPKDEHFIMENLPEKMQIKSDVEIDSFANGLMKFTIESAIVKIKTSESIKTNTVIYQLFSGMTYQLDMYKQEDTYITSLSIDKASSNSLLDKQLENWSFVIPKFKYDALLKNLADTIEKRPEVLNVEKKD